MKFSSANILFIFWFLILLNSPSSLRAKDSWVEVGGNKFELYLVKEGDTLWKIAEEKLADPLLWEDVLWKNNRYLKSPDQIYPGQPLLIPLSQTPEIKEGEKEEIVKGLLLGDFVNLGRSPEQEWLSSALKETIASDLNRIPELPLVNKKEGKSILVERKPQYYLLQGGFQFLADDKLRLEGKIINLQKEELLAEEEVTGDPANIFELKRILILRLINNLIVIPDQVRADIFSGEKASLEAFKAFSKGNLLSRRGEKREARRYYSRALKIDPHYREAREALGRLIGPPDTLAIMTLENKSGLNSLDWINSGIRSVISEDLKKIGFSLREYDPRGEKPDLLLNGVYYSDLRGIEIELKLIDTQSGWTVLSQKNRGNPDSIFDWELDFVKKTALNLNSRISPEEFEDKFAQRPAPETIKKEFLAGKETKKEREKTELVFDRIAVISFKNLKDNDQEHNWLSTAIAETISSDLSRVPDLTVLEREKIEGILQEKKLRNSSLNQAKKLQELGFELGAEYLLGGDFNLSDQEITIRGKIIKTENKEIIAAVEIGGALDHIFELERILLLKLLEMVTDLSDSARVAILTGDKTSLETLEQVSKGRSLFYLGQSQEAREYYKKALKTDPKYKAALEDLKKMASTADTLAVLPLKNASGKKELEWLSLGVAESLSTDIKKLTGIFLVERAQIEKALEELKLGSMGGIVDEKTAPELGKILGAGIILVGSYQSLKDTIRIDIRMVDVVTTQILFSETVNGPLDNIFGVETTLAEKVAEALHVELSPEERKKLLAEKPDLESFKRYIMAQGSIEIIEKSEEGNVTKIRSLALNNFENVSKDPEYDWLISGIPGSLNTELQEKSKISLIERTQIEKALEELKLASTGLVSEENTPQLGKMVGADAVLTGLYQISGESIRIDAKVIRVETGEVISGGKVNGSLKNIFDLEKKLAENIILGLNALSGAAKDKQESRKEQFSTAKTEEKEKQEEEVTEENFEKLLRRKKEELSKKTDEELIKNINHWLTALDY